MVKYRTSSILLSFATALVLVVASSLTLTSCNPEAKAVSGIGVEVYITEEFASSGVMTYIFSTNKEAYYHVGIVPAEEAPDTTNSSSVRTFMNLKLDEAYADYLYWRSELLRQGTPYVAEFPTHSLLYGTVRHTFTFLEPGKDYMIYAFVVNATNNKPDGRLFTHYVSTESESLFEGALQFEYRVRGYWDYIYPVNQVGETMSWVPWVGYTVDSLELIEMGSTPPKEYFISMFSDNLYFKDQDQVHFGIYVHNNNGIGDGSSLTLFEGAHTYYTGLSMMDGYLSKKTFVIYKFHWVGESTQLFFTKEQALTTEW